MVFEGDIDITDDRGKPIIGISEPPGSTVQSCFVVIEIKELNFLRRQQLKFNTDGMWTCRLQFINAMFGFNLPNKIGEVSGNLDQAWIDWLICCRLTVDIIEMSVPFCLYAKFRCVPALETRLKRLWDMN